MESDSIRSGQLWEHDVTGDEYTVLEPRPEQVPEGDEAHPPNYSEPYVYVEAHDYDEYETIWLAKRLFDSQMELVES